uniref:Uncharacterized protein n=1 Tax=Oryzias latipes TaxID=8090 RepID=A0A3B3I5K8_ORYLA
MCTRNPLSCTRNPLSCTRNPLSCTRNPLMCTRNPLSCTRNPLMCTRNPLSCTRNPLSCTRNPLSCTRNPLIGVLRTPWRDVVSPRCPGSCLGSPPSGTCWNTSAGRHPEGIQTRCQSHFNWFPWM